MNQVFVHHDSEIDANQNIVNVDLFLRTLNNNQYQYLMTMISTHPGSSFTATDAQEIPSNSISIFSSISLNPILFFKYFRIMDSNASKYICLNANLFTSIYEAYTKFFISLPNKTNIPV